MRRSEFRKLYNDLVVRVKEERKTNSSWLMGYVQGLGKGKLTGYQFAALVDLLLVHPEESVKLAEPEASDACSDGVFN